MRCGQALFETGQLRFFFTIAECVQQAMPNVALLSSVLQYLPQPDQVLDDLINTGIPYIVIDRTPFSDRAENCITIQHVPPSIYKASYPCRVFSKKLFLDKFRGRYEVVAQFTGSDGSGMAGQLEFVFGGMVLRKV